MQLPQISHLLACSTILLEVYTTLRSLQFRTQTFPPLLGIEAKKKTDIGNAPRIYRNGLKTSKHRDNPIGKQLT